MTDKAEVRVCWAPEDHLFETANECLETWTDQAATILVSHAAYERERLRADEWYEKFARLEVNRAGCCSQMEEERDAARAELKRVREVCADLNRQNNTTFQQSCINKNALDAERAKVRGLVEALECREKTKSCFTDEMLPCGDCKQCLAIEKFGGEK